MNYNTFMQISIITLFPKMVQSFLSESIVARAQAKKLVEIEVVNLRDFARDAYGTVDDKPYGGGAGMILKVDVLHDAIQKTTNKTQNLHFKKKVILTSPRGVVYNQQKAQSFALLDHLILVAGHYEGVDERILQYIDEEVSFGDFVMTGGEIAVGAIVDSVVRLIPGVLKKSEAVERESFFEIDVQTLLKAVGRHEILLKMQERGVEKVRLLEYPHYTRPETYQDMTVPTVLLSGNHADIDTWRVKRAFEETLKRRSDLLLVSSDL